MTTISGKYAAIMTWFTTWASIGRKVPRNYFEHIVNEMPPEMQSLIVINELEEKLVDDSLPDFVFPSWHE